MQTSLNLNTQSTKTTIVEFERTYLLNKYCSEFKYILEKKKVDINEITTTNDKFTICCPFSSSSRVIQYYNQLIDKAIKTETSKIEFVPINADLDESCDLDVIVSSVIAAMKSKYSINLIASAKELSKAEETKVYEFNQYLVSPESDDEYTDIVLMIYNKDFESLRKKFATKLRKFEWV